MEKAACVLKRVIPILAVRDLEEAVAYCRDILGVELAWRWGTPPTRAGVVRDGVELQLVSDRIGAPAGPSYVHCRKTMVDAYYLECRNRGAPIHAELGDRPFGMRDFPGPRSKWQSGATSVGCDYASASSQCSRTEQFAHLVWTVWLWCTTAGAFRRVQRSSREFCVSPRQTLRPSNTAHGLHSRLL